jgi:hypothetical protein
MKFNIYEDSIEGEVKDGSINMHGEVDKILYELQRKLGERNTTIGALWESEDIPFGRLEFIYSKSEKTIKWYLVGYYKDRDIFDLDYQPSFSEVAKFEFSKRVIANAYRYLVKKILTEHPEIVSYKPILHEYRILCKDFDVFSKNGLITGGDFIKSDPTYYANFEAQWPLDTYLEDIDHVAKSYVIPHDIKFQENFRDVYYKTLNRAIKIVKPFQKGTFEGRRYEFKSMAPTISTSHNAYDPTEKMMRTMFFVSVNFTHFYLDGENMRDIVIPIWDRGTKGTNPETEYYDRISEYLKKAFKKFNINYG